MATIFSGMTFGGMTFVNELPTLSYLVVAGGGSGGREGFNTGLGGGGGAGGLLSGTTTFATSTAYTVTVGAGGTAPAAASIGGNGSNSVFSTNTAIGGGGGGGGASVATVGNGGSGGGGGGSSQAGGTGTAGPPIQGYAGGTATSNLGGATAAAGGGGASAVGGNGVSNLGGAGGPGIQSSIAGLTTWSGSFNGSSQYLSTLSSSGYAFGTGNFTIEFWVYRTSAARQDWFDLNGGTNRLLIYAPSTFPTYYSTGGVGITSSIAISLSTWAHIAVVRISGTTTLYVNGVSGGTYTDSLNFNAQPLTIGKDSGGSTYVTGNISNLRIVNGVGVYTGAFTPPTSSLTATQSAGTNIAAITGSQTSLLTLQNSIYVDNSVNALTITTTGNPTTTSSIAPSITGLAAYYSGGGGGSAYTTVGTGGAGGGGAGSSYSAYTGVSGAINTGGGGGGGSNGSFSTPGSGGSGIVILKIPDTYTGTVSGGLTSTLSTAVSGYKIYSITAGTGTITFT